MKIKQPAVGDGSHWEIVDWDNLDDQLVGMIWKITQGTDYIDPTCPAFWVGAGRRKLPRSVFHFFEANDVPAQVENYLTSCEDIGIIKSGVWMAEIEPVLDAEYKPTTTLDKAKAVVGIRTEPRIRPKALADLRNPELYLVRRTPRISRIGKYDLAAVNNTTVTGPVLADQYKLWLDLVEAEVGIKSIIYTSKWMWMHTGFPAWARDYLVWDAQYPYNPDGQEWPLYYPYGNFKDLWGWQYSASAVLKGVTGYMDATQANYTIERWKQKYGGTVVTPPEPPTGGEMSYSLTTIPSVGTVIMRQDHSIASAEAGYFLNEQIAKGAVIWEGNGEKWMQTTSIEGVPMSVWIPVVRGTKTYTNLKEDIVIPPVGGLPILHLSVYADGYETKTLDLNPL